MNSSTSFQASSGEFGCVDHLHLWQPTSTSVPSRNTLNCSNFPLHNGHLISFIFLINLRMKVAQKITNCVHGCFPKPTDALLNIGSRENTPLITILIWCHPKRFNACQLFYKFQRAQCPLFKFKYSACCFNHDFIRNILRIVFHFNFLYQIE